MFSKNTSVLCHNSGKNRPKMLENCQKESKNGSPETHIMRSLSERLESYFCKERLMFQVSDLWKKIYPSARVGVLVIREVINPPQH